jgi:NitT/TauT family transport system substrate-binding protein
MNTVDSTLRRRRRWAAAIAFPLIALAACGSDDEASTDDGSSDTSAAESDVVSDTDGVSGTLDAVEGLTEVNLQLQWFAQSQFGGYYAALENGYYEDQGLDVTILEGAVDIVPQQVLGSEQADFAISWVPKVLASREEGLELTDIGQIFQRSGTLQVSWAEDDITSAADLNGTLAGNWGFGNEFELLAGIRAAGLDPDTDVELVQQNFDMQALLNREIGSAQAMIYNEFGILLQTENPETGELYNEDLFNVINWNDERTAMLQDAIWARTEWLDDPENADVATRFLKGSLQGWAFCRDNVDECAALVVANGSALNEVHMRYMMNEINALIWPSPDGIGVMNEDSWAQTVSIAQESGLITEDPGPDAYDNQYVLQAIAELAAEGVDLQATGYEKPDFDLAAAMEG